MRKTADTKLCLKILALAEAAGGPGTKAEIILNASTKLPVSVLNGRDQGFTQATSRRLVVRLITADNREATVSTENLSDSAIQALVAQVANMAKVMPVMPYPLMATPDQIARKVGAKVKALDMIDRRAKPTVDTLREAALAAEAAALAVPGVTSSGGASASFRRGRRTVVSSAGLAHTVSFTSFSLGVEAIATKDDEQVNAGEWTAACHWTDLLSPAAVGRKAGQDAVKKLGAAPIATKVMPVVFDREIASELLSPFLNGITGDTVAKGLSFLKKDSLGTQVWNPAITIVDDPTLPRMFGSQAFDDEGLPSERFELVSNGRLNHLLLDLKSAHQLGMAPNGRSDGSTSTYILPSQTSVSALIADIGYGLLVTGTIGHADNLITGEFTRGAEGFLIENGQITRPVKDVTLAGNLKDMFLSARPANDLDLKRHHFTPSLRVDGLTVGGAA
jgi:PmbA protein